MRGEARGRDGAESIQQELAPQRLSLKMLDCYRPERAVHDMVAWARNGRETAGRAALQSRLSAKPTCSGSAISPTHSAHSTGAAVDLTLVDLKADNSAASIPPRPMPIAPRPWTRARRKAASIWAPAMIVPIPKAHTAAASITPAQRRWRNLLVSAMGRQGFVNYSKEWWHFSLPGAGGPAYDFPITARHN